MEILKNDFDEVYDYLKNLATSDLVNFHNNYCIENGYSDDEINFNDEEFFELFFANNVMGAIRAISYGEYNYTDTYIKFNGYANLETSDNAEEWIDITKLTNDALENPNNYDIVFDED
jgi:hypothetical protein